MTVRTGVVPLRAFFPGLLVVLLSLGVNSIYPHHGGGWPDLARGVTTVLIIIVASLYVLVFGVAAFWLLIRYGRDSTRDIGPAKLAAALYGISMAGLAAIWVLSS